MENKRIKKSIRSFTEKNARPTVFHLHQTVSQTVSLEIFEGVVAFIGVVKLGSITNVTQSAT